MQGLGERPRPSFMRRSPLEIGLMAFIFVFFMFIVVSLIPQPPKDLETNYCPQPAAIVPNGNFKNSSIFFEPSYREKSVEKLAGAIQIPTESFDDMGSAEDDERFDIFYKFQHYLVKTFPKSAKHGNLETVNVHGLLYTFPGSNPGLKPVLLMAHQDVVPVNNDTVSDWTYGPFSGHFDGEWIYGRGSSDTKNTLVGILEATESLLHQGWQPERTLLLAFGYDEEISGTRGALELSRTIEDRYGKDSLELIVDEGFGMVEQFGSVLAMPTVAEKGMLDLVINLYTPGGHSSIPPDHTGIGIVSELVVALEDHPFSSSLTDDNPVLGMLRCVAEHGKNVNKEMRRTILEVNEGKHRELLINHLDEDPRLRYLIRTSQAVDVIKGGVKVNALPEKVELMVNYRISMENSVESIIDRLEAFTMQLAERYNFGGILSQGETLREGPLGNFTIDVMTARMPSPISPYEGHPWNLLGGTTRHVFEEVASKEFHVNRPLIVAPTVFPAGTDTKWYWPLTRAIYRFAPAFTEDMVDYHTVNERLRFRSHLASVAWFYEFIINTTL